jgi:putative hydrolase of the HAD superfamily
VTTTIEVLLFDLGGVLVEFSGVQDVVPLLREKLSEAEIRERWRHCPHTWQYGNGKLSRQEFGEHFVRAWGLNVSPEVFLGEFRNWSKRLLPGAAELLAVLQSRFRLAALSNSNELHWERNTHDLGLTGYFEVAISSHQIGIHKPDAATYLSALERLGVPPQAVMFFDDTPINVEAAKALGIHAFQVEGVEGVQARLIQEGLLKANNLPFKESA